MNCNIGIIGKGFVGTAVAKGFAQFANIKIYDKDPKKSTHSFEEVIDSDFVFICVPTPMIDAKGGKANLSILEGCIKDIYGVSSRNKDAIFIIKCTVPIGTTRAMSETYSGVKLVHSPEFLTARSAIIDFICPARNIVGAVDADSGNKVVELLKERFPGTPCLPMSSNESETVKYMANCFFATKVTFFNEMKLFVDKKGMDWDRIIGGVMSDGRIGTSHYQVPGHDGDRGFGGTCFPKDINAMIATMEGEGIDPLVLKSVWEQNTRVRENWDWATNSSAVCKENEDE